MTTPIDTPAALAAIESCEPHTWTPAIDEAPAVHRDENGRWVWSRDVEKGDIVSLPSEAIEDLVRLHSSPATRGSE